MNKDELKMVEWFLGPVTLLESIAKGHIDRYDKEGKEYKQAKKLAEKNNNPAKALEMAHWEECIEYSEMHAFYMWRDVKGLRQLLEEMLPVKPTLTLVVNNKKQAPAVTDAQHIAKKREEKV